MVEPTLPQSSNLITDLNQAYTVAKQFPEALGDVAGTASKIGFGTLAASATIPLINTRIRGSNRNLARKLDAAKNVTNDLTFLRNVAVPSGLIAGTGLGVATGRLLSRKDESKYSYMRNTVNFNATGVAAEAIGIASLPWGLNKFYRRGSKTVEELTTLGDSKKRLDAELLRHKRLKDTLVLGTAGATGLGLGAGYLIGKE